MFNILFLFVIIPVLTLGALFLTHKQARRCCWCRLSICATRL